MPYDGLNIVASTSRASNAGRPPRCRYACRMSCVFVNMFGGQNAVQDTGRSTNDVTQRLPQPTPVLAAEVDVVDVLVALRRVLRVLERAVGAAVEPLGMLLQPRVVGRALDREVDADLTADLPAAGHHPLELLDRPELRADGLVTAVVRTDRPRAAGIALRRHERVVLPLAVRAADRMDRRQVDDIEPKLCELRQNALDALEPAPRAGEELVPRAECGSL